MIVAAFNSLKTVALEEYPNEFRPFVDYFERQWIKTVSVTHFIHTLIFFYKCSKPFIYHMFCFLF